MAGSSGLPEDIVAFFSSILERKFTEAERMLVTIEEGLVSSKIDGSSRRKRAISAKKKEENLEHIAGYIKALEGILTAARSGDERTFLNRLPSETESLERIRRDFSKFIRNKIHPPFDQGFFTAWLDFITYQQNLLAELKSTS
ncbi:MAG: hypothetical protein ACETVR_03480 [Candidatus Bathyarchaeia archaeon]